MPDVMDILGDCNWKANINLGNKHNRNEYEDLLSAMFVDFKGEPCRISRG